MARKPKGPHNQPPALLALLRAGAGARVWSWGSWTILILLLCIFAMSVSKIDRAMAKELEARAAEGCCENRTSAGKCHLPLMVPPVWAIDAMQSVPQLDAAARHAAVSRSNQHWPAAELVHELLGPVPVEMSTL